MAHVVRKLSLSRRSFLRGAGAAIALPWLDAMCPAATRSPRRPLRSVFVFAPNGVKMDDWRPATAGAAFELPFILAPLAPVRDSVSVLSNLAIDAGRPHGDGPGDHARASASYLTCAHPRKTGGSDIRVGVSVDQLIARQQGAETVFPSLELGMEAGRQSGSCDSGYSCAYSNNISWPTPTTPMAKEVDPRAAFARMFGKPGADGLGDARNRRRLASVLDAALDDARRLRSRLGASDRGKLDDYLTAVRDVETRLAKLASNAGKADIPADFWQRDDGPRFVARLQLMYDIIVLALQSDQTRTVSFMLGNAGSNRSYRFLDIPDGHHSLSHHRGDPHKLDKIRRINRFHVEQFARFLARLQQTDDGGNDLLYRSMIAFGSGLGDGNRHDHLDLPMLFAGQGNGRFRQGRHLVFPKRTPAANLYLTMLQSVGVAAERFADSTGRLAV